MFEEQYPLLLAVWGTFWGIVWSAVTLKLYIADGTCGELHNHLPIYPLSLFIGFHQVSSITV
jgi:hypothetical protein